MRFLLCIHTTYTSVDSALARDNKIIAASSITKEQASAQLIPTISKLLQDKDLRLSDISHIIVNQGPAPFTTLRTIIATANGIAFAHDIPMIGIDALEVFMLAHVKTHQGPTVVLLNAFNKAVYYGIIDNAHKRKLTGYATIENCIAMIHELCNDSAIQFLGNGTQLYQKELINAFKDRALLQEPLPLTPTIQQILDYGFEQLQITGNTTLFVEPLYLKKPLS